MASYERLIIVSITIMVVAGSAALSAIDITGVGGSTQAQIMGAQVLALVAVGITGLTTLLIRRDRR